MKRIFLTTVFLLLGVLYTISLAQISDMIYAKAEDYNNDILKRTLLVEIIELDQTVVDDYKDQIARAKKEEKKQRLQKDLDGYLQFNKTFNEQLKAAVDKYWKLNSKKEYKTKAEILSIPEGERNKYVALFYKEVGDNGSAYGRFPGMGVPMLYYDRLERYYTSKRNLIPDYKIYLPSSYVREDGAYADVDIIFAVRAMQSNIQYIASSDKKPLNFEKFAKVMAVQNCKKLFSKTIQIEDKLIHKTLEAGEINNISKNECTIVTLEEVNSSMKEAKEGEAIVLTIPFGIAKGGVGPVATAAYAFVKVIADSQTGEILGFMEPGMGEFFDYQIRPSTLKELCNCESN